MKKSRGITLIALIITIIVMLILVAVSIRVALNTGLFKSAGDATKNWKSAQDIEGNIGNGIEIGGKKYSSMEDYIKELDSKISIDYEIEKGFDVGKIKVTAQYKGEKTTDEEYVAYMKQKLGNLEGTENEKLAKKQLLLLDAVNFKQRMDGNPEYESTDALFAQASWEDFVNQVGNGNVDQALLNFKICPEYWYMLITKPDGTEEISMEDTLEPFTIEYEVTEAIEYEFTAKVFGKENSKTVVIKDKNGILIEKVEGNEADWEYDTEDDGTVTLNCYKGSETNVIIPNYIDGKRVKNVSGKVLTTTGPGNVHFRAVWSNNICDEEQKSFFGQGSYYYLEYTNKNINNINISEGIEGIYYMVFAGTKGINEIIIPKGVKIIDEGAFAFCENLTKIRIPEELNSIGTGAFCECVNLKEITIPSNVKTVGRGILSNIPEITVKVPFKNGTTPEGWNANWAETNENCKINIIYAK